MLHACCDDVIPGFEQAIDSQVQGLGDIGSKNHAHGIWGSKNPGNALSCAVNEAPRLDGVVVCSPPRIGPDVLNKLAHCLSYAGRLGPHGCRII